MNSTDKDDWEGKDWEELLHWAENGSDEASVDSWDVVSSGSDAVLSFNSFPEDSSFHSLPRLFKEALVQKPCCSATGKRLKPFHTREERIPPTSKSTSFDEDANELELEGVACGDKPMADKLRAKYNTVGRRRFLQGHTGRRRGYVWKNLGEASIERREHRSQGLTALDLLYGKDKGAPTTISLNKRYDWERLPAILEKEHLSTQTEATQQRWGRHSRFQEITTYQLPVLVSHYASSNTQKHTSSERIIYYHPAAKKTSVPSKVFAVLTTEVPDGVRGVPLTWKWRRNASSHHSSKVFWGRHVKPIVHGSMTWFAQDDSVVDNDDPKKKKKKKKSRHRPFLEIDLEQTKTVTSVSTQGEAPHICKYPKVHKRGCEKRGGGCFVEGWYRKKDYNGPYWWVLSRHQQQRLRWVRSYEMLWRSDGGRQWNSLGVFKGNHDAATEKAHVLAAGGGIRCRYLRFVPLDCEEHHGGAALRVAIYGYDHDGNVSRTEESSSCSQQTCTDQIHRDDDDEEEETVEYWLSRPSPIYAVDALEPDVCSSSGGSNWRRDSWLDLAKKKNRHELKRRAKQAASDFNSNASR